MRCVYLNITSWVGTSAIGAQHYYGKLKWRTVKDRYEYHELELKRPMTAKEIRQQNTENAENGYTWKIKKGELTRGFMTRDEVVSTGKAKASKLFNTDSYILLDGDGGSLSAQPLLYCPTSLESVANKINELASVWDRIGGYGYAFSAANKARDDRAEQIDAEWLTLMRSIVPEV